MSDIVFQGERFVVVADRGGRDAVHSATVPRKDGTYINKLTLHGVINRDAGLYVCLCTNDAGYSFRRAYLAVLPRECCIVCILCDCKRQQMK